MLHNIQHIADLSSNIFREAFRLYDFSGTDERRAFLPIEPIANDATYMNMLQSNIGDPLTRNVAVFNMMLDRQGSAILRLLDIYEQQCSERGIQPAVVSCFKNGYATDHDLMHTVSVLYPLAVEQDVFGQDHHSMHGFLNVVLHAFARTGLLIQYFNILEALYTKHRIVDTTQRVQVHAMFHTLNTLCKAVAHHRDMVDVPWQWREPIVLHSTLTYMQNADSFMHMYTSLEDFRAI